jgi:hypothetical protein
VICLRVLRIVSYPGGNAFASGLRRTLHVIALAIFAIGGLTSQVAPAQVKSGGTVTADSATPVSWVQTGVANELRMIDQAGNFPLRYRSRRVDAKADTTRDIIEAREGTVARMIERDGRPLTASEDALERQRLTALLNSPGEFARRRKHEAAARGYMMDMIRELPRAMIFTFDPGQPQRPGSSSPQVVINFTPNPHYKAPSMIATVLTGLEGRMWISRDSHCLTRIEVRVLRPVDIGWGMLARIYPGGTAELEQVDTGGDRWALSRVREDVTVREMMLRTAQQRVAVDAGNFQVLPALVSYQEAIRLLLATPLPKG